MLQVILISKLDCNVAINANDTRSPVLFRPSSAATAADVEQVELEGVSAAAAVVSLVAPDEFGQQVQLLLGSEWTSWSHDWSHELAN